MYGKELSVVVFLLALTAIPTSIGINSSLLKDVPLIQGHLEILIIIYLILFHIGSILSYETYSRYRRPNLLWKLLDRIKVEKRSHDVEKGYIERAPKNYNDKLIDIAFDDINSNEYEKKEVGLTQIMEMFSDSRILIPHRKSIISKLLESIYHESSHIFKNKLMKALYIYMNNVKDEENLLD